MRVMVQHIADDHGGAFEPRNAPQRRKVRFHRVVAVARLPARRLVARNRLHLHVGRQKIVAAMRFVPAAVEEILRVEALAMSRPCMSTCTARTVSIRPSATSVFKVSKSYLELIRSCPCSLSAAHGPFCLY